MNRLIDKRTIIVVSVNPGYSIISPEKIRTIAPIITLAILVPFPSPRWKNPVATRPAPYMKTNIEINQIRESSAAIGCARVKNPPMIATMPMPMFIALVFFGAALFEIPPIMLAIPTTINDMPRNVRKNPVVVIGFARTNPDKAIAIPPMINCIIRNPLDDF